MFLGPDPDDILGVFLRFFFLSPFFLLLIKKKKNFVATCNVVNIDFPFFFTHSIKRFIYVCVPFLFHVRFTLTSTLFYTLHRRDQSSNFAAYSPDLVNILS